jgi:hypothetical protein
MLVCQDSAGQGTWGEGRVGEERAGARERLRLAPPMGPDPANRHAPLPERRPPKIKTRICILTERRKTRLCLETPHIALHLASSCIGWNHGSGNISGQTGTLREPPPTVRDTVRGPRYWPADGIAGIATVCGIATIPPTCHPSHPITPTSHPIHPIPPTSHPSHPIPLTCHPSHPITPTSHPSHLPQTAGLLPSKPPCCSSPNRRAPPLQTAELLLHKPHVLPSLLRTKPQGPGALRRPLKFTTEEAVNSVTAGRESAAARWLYSSGHKYWKSIQTRSVV